MSGLMAVLVFLSAAVDANAEILSRRPGGLTAEISFSSWSEGEYYTRFILSSTRPAVSYVIAGSDTIRDPGIQDDGAEALTIGQPVTLQHFTLYPVMVKPSVRRGGCEIRIKRVRVALDFAAPARPRLPPSLASVYRSLIWNYEYDPAAKPQGMLIIAPNSFSGAVQPLARWKEKKGWKVTVATLSQTGSTTASIKNYITNAYQTWDPAPEYVILVGDRDSMPTFTINSNPTDHPYTTLEGSDFFSELLVGRLSVANVNDLNTVVAKIVGYESAPYMTDTAWFGRGLMVGANYPSGMTTPVPMKRLVRERMLEAGFRAVDTVYYPPVSNGVAQITSAVNQGVTVINYRGGIATWGGWDYPSFYNTDVQGLSNGWKLPVITSIVCLTGNYNAEPCFGESWLRAGNPATPKGGIGFFGASPPTTHSRWNNCLDAGIYWGLLDEDIHDFGPMTYRGKMEVYLNFPLETSPTAGSEFYFNAYNLIGDPSLELWTSVPKSFNVSHASAIPTGANRFTVQVLDAQNQPVENALVSLFKRNEVRALEFTDPAGQAVLQIGGTTPDTLFVTVTRHDYRPYCGFALVSNAGVYVGYYAHTVSDPGGNNNGEINPGETIQVQVTLRNFGATTTADNVSCKLSCADPLVAITDSVKGYGSIAPGGNASAPPFIFSVSTAAKNGRRLRFVLSVTSDQGGWESNLDLPVMAPDLEYGWHQVADGGNLILEPGESSDLIVSLNNAGGLAGTGLSGLLRSLNPAVAVLDSTGSYADINPGDSASNSTDRYRVTCQSSAAPGHAVDLALLVFGSSSFRDTVYFTIIIGPVSSSSPLGPDGYGYYAYDNTDAGYPETPVYSWIELDPAFGGPGAELPILGDETKTIPIPFTFKYYGADYNRVSICANGYLAMDSTWVADMYNWHIPSAGGPPLLFAPFWDDLDPNATDSSRGIYYYSDAANHRFVIEYSRIQHLHDPTNPQPAELETFESVLYDPAFYPTQTGDGEIVFQYYRIVNDDQWHDYATVGIEDRDHASGLEYTFANLYPAAAAALCDGRAIKFTTDQPDPFPGCGEVDDGPPVRIGLTVSPNPARGRIEFQLDPGIGHSAKSIELNIYDITGRCIRSFSRPPALCSSPFAIAWSCIDQTGRAVPPGVYFAALSSGPERSIVKFIIIE